MLGPDIAKLVCAGHSAIALVAFPSVSFLLVDQSVFVLPSYLSTYFHNGDDFLASRLENIHEYNEI
jgi:hypothetical protein